MASRPQTRMNCKAVMLGWNELSSSAELIFITWFDGSSSPKSIFYLQWGRCFFVITKVLWFHLLKILSLGSSISPPSRAAESRLQLICSVLCISFPLGGKGGRGELLMPASPSACWTGSCMPSLLPAVLLGEQSPVGFGTSSKRPHMEMAEFAWKESSLDSS